MPRVTRQEYLDELNRRLQLRADFEPGMRFVFAPSGSTAEAASGYSFAPEGQPPPHCFVLVVAEVHRAGWWVAP